MTKETLELLVMLSYTSNRSISQTKELFELCDYDFNKLLKVEACIKRTYAHYCPADKYEVDILVVKWDELRKTDVKHN